jgi:Superfamily II DNA/RNA helicases, SNF2 family
MKPSCAEDATADVAAKTQIHSAIRSLAEVCDGAFQQDGRGFNKFDAPRGHALANLPLENWTARQTWAAWHLLRKYQGQLEIMGFFHAQMRPPEPVQAESSQAKPIPKPSLSVSLNENLVKFCFHYDPALVAAVKQLPGRRFNPQDKTWTVPLNIESAPQLAAFLLTHEATGSDALETRLEAMSEEMTLNLRQSIARDEASVDIPGLLPFQRAGVAYAERTERCFIADGMGLGKTVQALALLGRMAAFPAVVVCPASLKLNWQREAGRWLPGKKTVVLNGKDSVNGADLYIVNYDILQKHLDKLRSLMPCAIIADESHYAKNRNAQRTKALHALMEGVRYRLCLTGTPILNRPQELISQLDCLGRLQDLGGFWNFANRYCGAMRTEYGLDLSGATNLGELATRLRACCMIRREKADVLQELPSKQLARVILPLSNDKEYAHAETSLLDWIAEHKGWESMQKAERAEALVRIETLKQLCARGKLEAAIEWVENLLETGEKLVLFAVHQEIQNALQDAFPGAARIFGKDSSEERQANVDRFQNDPGCRLIVCSLAAGGVGLTLTAASHVAFLELGWNPGTHEQAEDRLHRIGQHKAVMVWYLLAKGTIDEEIEQLVNEKRTTIQSTTGPGDESTLANLTARLQARIKR